MDKRGVISAMLAGGPTHSRTVRLPGNRYRLEIEEKLTLARNKAGDIDVPATTQLLNDVVERWIREDPGQWMWIHRRWEQSGRKRRKRPLSGATA